MKAPSRGNRSSQASTVPCAVPSEVQSSKPKSMLNFMKKARGPKECRVSTPPRNRGAYAPQVVAGFDRGQPGWLALNAGQVDRASALLEGDQTTEVGILERHMGRARIFTFRGDLPRALVEAEAAVAAVASGGSNLDYNRRALKIFRARRAKRRGALLPHHMTGLPRSRRVDSVADRLWISSALSSI